jgi:aminoglycoside phosphotransferase (APT) family kinase protein
LVHGDFAVQNARLRSGQAGTSLLILDWEGAGWGTPATDLAQFIGKALSPDVRTYFSVVSQGWPGVTLAVVERLAVFGRMLRLITALEWANWGFKAVDAGWYMEKMHWCERTLAGWIRTALQGWSLY